MKTKKELSAEQMRIRHRLARDESIERISDAEFPFFALIASNDERDCSWCKASSGKKFPVDTDINKLIEENCTCEYCRCTVAAKRH